MSFEPEDIRKIAHLARLTLPEDDIPRITEKMSQVIDLVDQINSADTSGIEPMAHPLGMVQRRRPDEVTEANIREEVQGLAPSAEAGLYLVPKVIDGE